MTLLTRCLPILPILLLSCGNSPDPVATPAARTISAQLLGQPSVSWQADRGATTVVLKFSARLGDDTPLGAEDVDVEMLVDDQALDNESVLQQGAQQLEIDLRYNLVLDATYSMLLHSPPAFEPMKEAARKSVVTGSTMWKARPGTFGWQVTWFDDSIYRPDGAWTDANLLDIPTPEQGSFTRLFAAVDNTLSMIALDQNNLTASARSKQHNVMVVFSDGKDNHSGWSNEGLDEMHRLSNGQSYHRLGWPSTALEDILRKISDTPALTLHTIGMGSDVNDSELQRMAAAGRGIYVKNPGSSGISALFERVTREFTTIQTHGATIPNLPGDYTFSVRIRQHGGGAQTTIRFRIHAGDPEARYIAET